LNRTARNAIPVTILVATLAVAAIVLSPRPDASTAPTDAAVSVSDNPLATPATFGAVPTATPARPSAKAIYKGHTLDEIRADPSLLAEVLAEADYIRPIHGEPEPPIPDAFAHTLCLNAAQCR
jgi:hypothetical protein